MFMRSVTAHMHNSWNIGCIDFFDIWCFLQSLRKVPSMAIKECKKGAKTLNSNGTRLLLTQYPIVDTLSISWVLRTSV